MTAAGSADKRPPGSIAESSRSRAVASPSAMVYRRIREEIVAGSLKPGQRLRVESLSARYNAGAGAVRDALARLVPEGLIIRHDQRGFSVADISVAELREIVDARCWIEEVALAQSIVHRDQAWEDRVVRAYERLARTSRSTDPVEYRANQEWEARHRAFHEALIANCGSRFVLRFCRELTDQVSRYRHLAAGSAFPASASDAEHGAIMSAALAGRTEEATELLRRHYRRTLAIVTSGDIDPSGERSDYN